MKRLAYSLGCTILLLGWTSMGEAQPRKTMMRSARTMEVLGKHEEALRIYRQLYTQDSEDIDAFYGLQRVLMRLRRLEELAALFRERITTHPDDIDLQIQLGDILYRMGEEKEAYAQWDEIPKRDPKEMGYYSMVARQYALHQEFERALKVYRTGRNQLGEKSFAREMAGLYASQGDYRRATEEYLIYLGRGAGQYALVRKGLSGFPRSQETVNTVLDVLQRAVAEDSTHIQRQRLLGDYYLIAGHPDRAFGQILHIVKHLKTGEELLLELADAIVRAGHADMGIQAYRAFIEEFPDSRKMHRAILGLGDAQGQAGQYKEAIQTYRRLEHARYPGAQSEALYRMGLMYLDALSEPEQALPLFERLSRYSRSNPFASKGLLKTAECFVIMENLGQAKEVYDRIGAGDGSGEGADEIPFRAAEVAYLEGHFDEAIERCQTLVAVFPKGRFVNDALMLMTFIDENRSDPEALKRFGLSLLRERQKRPEEALVVLEQLRGDLPPSALQEEALLGIGRLKADQGDARGAIEAYSDLVIAYPESRRAPEAQKRIGEVYEKHLRDVAQAMRAYETMLMAYPESVLADEVRRRLRVLRRATSQEKEEEQG